MENRERRIAGRWGMERQVKAKIDKEGEFVSCWIKDINFRGLQLLTPEKIDKDSFVKLSLVLEERSVLNVDVWIVWSKILDGLHCYGMYFSKIKDSDRQLIYKFINKYYSEEMASKCWEGLDEKGGEAMLEKTFEDRRIFERFPARLSLKFLDLDSNREGQAESCDISAKGIGLVTNEELSPNTALEMWLNIPDKGEPLYTRGEVVWSRMLEPSKYRAGIELEKADLMGMARVLRTI
jgi:hypothetical protein